MSITYTVRLHRTLLLLLRPHIAFAMLLSAARTHSEQRIAMKLMNNAQQIELDLPRDKIEPRHTTHSGGKGEPFHDWYPYLEGFSSEFVKHMLSQYIPRAERIIEPFAGTGTAPIALSSFGIDCGYCEVNPAMQLVILSKVALGNLESTKRLELQDALLNLSFSIENLATAAAPDKSLLKDYQTNFALSKFFNDDTFRVLLAIKTVNNQLNQHNPLLGMLLTVSVMSKIVTCSLLKRSGDVRYKTEKELAKGIPNLMTEVQNHLRVIASDCLTAPNLRGQIKLLANNAKTMGVHSDFLADGVITSPPYLNGTNYFRNTKLELWYAGFLSEKKALRSFRDQAITSGINDVAKMQGRIHINETVRALVSELEQKAYDMRIPRMVAGYFEDMEIVLKSLSKNCRVNGVICIDIGDSRYGGVHVPTHDILAAIGQEIGLEHLETVRLRTRISKDQTKLSQSLIVLQKVKNNANLERV
jgi:DNA modification methylase